MIIRVAAGAAFGELLIIDYCPYGGREKDDVMVAASPRYRTYLVYIIYLLRVSTRDWRDLHLKFREYGL